MAERDGPGLAQHGLTPGAGLRASRSSASHYPPPIADWFMQTARHRILGGYTLTGVEVIRHGVRECA